MCIEEESDQYDGSDEVVVHVKGCRQVEFSVLQASTDFPSPRCFVSCAPVTAPSVAKESIFYPPFRSV